jgi:hypothetical protein
MLEAPGFNFHKGKKKDYSIQGKILARTALARYPLTRGKGTKLGLRVPGKPGG